MSAMNWRRRWMRARRPTLNWNWKLKLTLIINVVVLGLVGWAFAGEVHRSQETSSEIRRLEMLTEEMQQRNYDLARLGQKMASQSALEWEARRNLGLQKPGEKAIIIKDAETKSPLPIAAKEQQDVTVEPDASSNLERWWRHYFNR